MSWLIFGLGMFVGAFFGLLAGALAAASAETKRENFLKELQRKARLN